MIHQNYAEDFFSFSLSRFRFLDLSEGRRFKFEEDEKARNKSLFKQQSGRNFAFRLLNIQADEKDEQEE